MNTSLPYESYPDDSENPVLSWVTQRDETMEEWQDVIQKSQWLDKSHPCLEIPPSLLPYQSILGHCDVHKKLYYKDTGCIYCNMKLPPIPFNRDELFF